MVTTLDRIRVLDFLRKPYFYNQLVRSSSQRYLDKLLRAVSTDALLLDIGCGERSVVPRQFRVVRGDFRHGCSPDVVFDAQALPFAGCTFDGVVCSWVLEHLEDPCAVLQEIGRVLRPSGVLYLTTNMAWHLHECPRDFYRFTEYGLRHLLSKGEWTVEFLRPTMGFWGTVSQMANYRIVDFLSRRRLHFLHPVITLPMQLFGLFMERRYFDSNLCAGYCVIARKSG